MRKGEKERPKLRGKWQVWFARRNCTSQTLRNLHNQTPHFAVVGARTRDHATYHAQHFASKFNVVNSQKYPFAYQLYTPCSPPDYAEVTAPGGAAISNEDDESDGKRANAEAASDVPPPEYSTLFVETDSRQ